MQDLLNGEQEKGEEPKEQKPGEFRVTWNRCKDQNRGVLFDFQHLFRMLLKIWFQKLVCQINIVDYCFCKPMLNTSS